MKSLLKSFRAGQLAKVLFLSLALTGGMAFLNAMESQAQRPKVGNHCYWNTEFCPRDHMGCIC
jgi:hypothetical protein